MYQGHISRLAGNDGKRQADDLGLHIIQAGGFAVERKQLGLLQFFQPDQEVGFAEDGLVMSFMRRRGGGVVELFEPGMEFQAAE